MMDKIKDLKSEIFDILEKQELLQQEKMRLEEIKKLKISELDNIRKEVKHEKTVSCIPDTNNSSNSS